jgi:hypothetical protein
LPPDRRFTLPLVFGRSDGCCSNLAPVSMRARLTWPLAAAAAVILVPSLLGRTAVEAAPKADLWPRWQAHDPRSTTKIDHGAYAGILDRYVRSYEDGINRVRYRALAGNDRAALEAYLASLQAVQPVGLTRQEQMAYWINFYNALTLKLIVDHYPVNSIRDIDTSPGFFSVGPWGQKLVTVMGERISLDDIEHRILRPIWQDPRIHYAVNCASIGCPNLQLVPFTADRLEAMLEYGAHDYVNHPRGVASVPRTFGGDQLTASRIYDWFQEDFGGNEAGVIAHLRQYATDETRQLLAGVETIDAYRYDWALNDSHQ